MQISIAQTYFSNGQEIIIVTYPQFNNPFQAFNHHMTTLYAK